MSTKTKSKPRFPLRHLLAAHAAVQLLDGYERIVGAGETERVVREPYRFAAEAYMPLAKAKIALGLVAEAHGKARGALIVARTPQGATGGIDSQKHPEAFAAVAEELNAMLDVQEEADLPSIPVGQLKLDDNPLPVSAVLAPLMTVGIVTG